MSQQQQSTEKKLVWSLHWVSECVPECGLFLGYLGRFVFLFFTWPIAHAGIWIYYLEIALNFEFSTIHK